ncbi:MAG: hypothetical protein JXM73_10060 [Anaerolineae bacterium]|nr:hypothetical protein [Anaerolineae bacterium]
MKQMEHTQETPPPGAPKAQKPYTGWSRLLVYGGLLLLSLALTGSFLRPDQCQTRGCSPYPALSVQGGEMLPADAVRATAQGQRADIWVEIGDTGVFTPTTTRSGTEIYTDDGHKIPYLDELAEKGYLAIRVPHAPPTYTVSSLVPGIPPYAPDPIEFNYYSPPTSTELTETTVNTVRRADLEALVNARYPISDGKSHWEVWWLPDGEAFPIPDAPFRLEADSWPPPLGLRFQIDFGAGSSALACAGCPIEVLAYNGYLFAGPYPFSLRYSDATIRDPLLSFGVHCAYEEPYVYPTVVQYITPTVPFTHAFCVENWDTVTRTVTVASLSEQGWDYAYYWQELSPGALPVPAGDPPFTVEVGPPPSDYEPGILGLLALYTPTITVSDTMRETLYLTATLGASPDVSASALSVALAPGYVLDEGETPPPPRYLIYLPLVVRSFP